MAKFRFYSYDVWEGGRIMNVLIGVIWSLALIGWVVHFAG